MKINTVKLISFSPTGTTQKIIESIAAGTGIETVNPINLTMADSLQISDTLASNELAVIGAPVYGGRLSVDAVQRFKKIKGDNTPAVIIVVYGNRAYEDALLELKHLALELGFIPVAGGAFIAEHSFATKEKPIANGRPGNEDLKTAEALGKKVQILLSELQSSENADDLQIPGDFPYKSSMPERAFSPVTTEDICTLCGDCADSCPTDAIVVNETVETDVGKCILCCACIKQCPTGARVMKEQAMLDIATYLYDNFQERKEPEVFI